MAFSTQHDTAPKGLLDSAPARVSGSSATSNILRHEVLFGTNGDVQKYAMKSMDRAVDNLMGDYSSAKAAKATANALAQNDNTIQNSRFLNISTAGLYQSVFSNKTSTPAAQTADKNFDKLINQKAQV